MLHIVDKWVDSYSQPEVAELSSYNQYLQQQRLYRTFATSFAQLNQTEIQDNCADSSHLGSSSPTGMGPCWMFAVHQNQPQWIGTEHLLLRTHGTRSGANPATTSSVHLHTARIHQPHRVARFTAEVVIRRQIPYTTSRLEMRKLT